MSQRISKGQWLVIAAMAANAIYDLVNLVLWPIEIFAVSSLLRCAIFLMVAVGMGWARVVYILIGSLTILLDVVQLLSRFLANSQYESLGYQTTTSEDIIVLVIVHLILSLWAVWVLAFSPSASEFFRRRKYGM